MKIHTLNYSCLLNTSPQKACEFHTDTHNLPLITPPWIHVDILVLPEPLIETSIIHLRIKRFGIPTIWKMMIETLQCPESVVDSMVSGPFKFFRHQRQFIPLENGETLMRETLFIRLPFGWLGNLFFPFIKNDMDKMFEYRHQATQHYFLKQMQ
jgi:ligand-binding SRPBCC domain-containing protein